MLRIIICTIIIFPLIFCDNEQKITRSFFYWRTKFELSDFEKNVLRELNVQKLFVRYFDVVVDPRSREAYPCSPIICADSLSWQRYRIIPVIYIQNAVFSECDSTSLDSLPLKIWNTINEIAQLTHKNFTEIQFDCDWTEKTRDRYFNFLRSIGRLADKASTLMATIRLHQVKYYERMGVPPVSRGMIMIYNMVSPSPDTICSIFDYSTAMRYTPCLRHYPLKYDIAYAIFSWGIHIRDGKVIGLINKSTSQNAKNIKAFQDIDRDKLFKVRDAYFWQGSFFREEDLIKIEEMNPALCREACRSSGRYLNTDSLTIALFDLDSINLTRFSTYDLEKIFDLYR